jgi:excisionase family DNA binding protein
MNDKNPRAADLSLLTVPEVAERLNTGERMARRLIAERRVPTVKIGRHVRVRAADLEQWIESNTRPAGGAQ